MKTLTWGPYAVSMLAVAGVVASSAVTLAQSSGPSTLTSLYVLPTLPAVQTTSLRTVGDSVLGYRMVGIRTGSGRPMPVTGSPTEA